MTDVPYEEKRPWGEERIWAKTKNYVGKVLVIEPGQRLSLQKHEVKEETLLLMTGQATFEYYPDGTENTRRVVHATPGYSLHIPPNMVHRISSDIGCEIIEVSTNHLDDIVRIQDDYGRVPNKIHPNDPAGDNHLEEGDQSGP